LPGRVALTLLLALPLGCAALRTPAPEARIEAALADLVRAGFEFDADVRFRYYRYSVCDGVACADLALIGTRRTIRIAPEAFENPSRLRATLLEIWERYQQPRPGSQPDLARGALRVIQDGPRVGVDDLYTLRRAHHIYRQLYEGLPPESRPGLPEPDTLRFP